MTTIIRPITQQDAQGYNRALDQVAREQLYLRLHEAPPVGSSLDFVAYNIAQGNPHFVLLDGEDVVGWCDICRSSDRGSEHLGNLGMGVMASHRGRGLGKALLASTLEAARSSFHRVELDVYESNERAIALYERAGFMHEGRRREAVRLAGRFEDLLTMGLLFAADR